MAPCHGRQGSRGGVISAKILVGAREALWHSVSVEHWPFFIYVRSAEVFLGRGSFFSRAGIVGLIGDGKALFRERNFDLSGAEKFCLSGMFCLPGQKKFHLASRASMAVAGRGGKTRTERSEGDGSRSPGGDPPDSREGELRRDRPMSTAMLSLNGVQGRSPLACGGCRGAGTRRPPCPSGADNVKLKEKEAPVAGPKTEHRVFRRAGFGHTGLPRKSAFGCMTDAQSRVRRQKRILS